MEPYFDCRMQIGYSGGRILKIDYNSEDRDRLMRLVILGPTGEEITRFYLERNAVYNLKRFLSDKNEQ